MAIKQNKQNFRPSDFDMRGRNTSRYDEAGRDPDELDEDLDPEVRRTSFSDYSSDEAYWRSQFRNRSYYQPDTAYSDYEPAYRYGYEAARQHSNKTFSEISDELERGWEKVKGKSELAWEHAKEAIRDAWERVTGS